MLEINLLWYWIEIPFNLSDTLDHPSSLSLCTHKLLTNLNRLRTYLLVYSWTLTYFIFRIYPFMTVRIYFYDSQNLRYDFSNLDNINYLLYESPETRQFTVRVINNDLLVSGSTKNPTFSLSDQSLQSDVLKRFYTYTHFLDLTLPYSPWSFLS